MHLACNFQIGPNRSAFLKCESIPSSSLQAILSCQIQQDPVSVGSSLWFLCCWQWHNANFQLLTSNSQRKWRKLQPVLFLVGPRCQSQCTQRGFVTRCFPLRWHQGVGSQAACKDLTGYFLSNVLVLHRVVGFGLPSSPTNLLSPLQLLFQSAAVIECAEVAGHGSVSEPRSPSGP